MKRRALQMALTALMISGISGCVQETVDGATRIYTYELWVSTLVLLAGIAAIPAGWFLRQTSHRYGWALLIIGPIAALFFAPSLFRDRVSVDDTLLSVRTGIWGMTAVHEVKLHELKQVRIVSEKTVGRRGVKKTKYYFVCERQAGSPEKVPASHELVEAAAPYFLEKLAERGIPVINET